MTKTSPLRGVRLYVAIMAAIKAEPMTAAQCAAHLGVTITHTRTVLWYLTHAGLAHVTDWTRVRPAASAYTPTFYGKPGTSAPYPGRLMGRKPGATVAQSAPRRKLAELIELAQIMRDHPMTVSEIRDMLGKAVSPHMHGDVRIMREAGLIHVYAWTRDSTQGPWSAVLRWGTGRDAPRPRRKTPAEIYAAYYQRQRAKRNDLRIAFALAGRPMPGDRVCQS